VTLLFPCTKRARFALCCGTGIRECCLPPALLWKVNHGRKCGKRFAPDYPEVRFEDLPAKREETLHRISAFVGYDLNLDHIQKNALGTLRDSSSTFRSTPQQDRPIGFGEHFSPHARLNCWNLLSAPRCLSWVMKLANVISNLRRRHADQEGYLPGLFRCEALVQGQCTSRQIRRYKPAQTRQQVS
jgi:hypothetical protein